MNKRILAGFLLGLFILLVDVMVPIVLAEMVAEKHLATQHLHDIDEQLLQLLSAYKDAETSQRGFMLAGTDEFLEPFVKGRNVIQTLLPEIQKNLAGNAEHMQHFSRLLQLDEEEEAFQLRRIEARRRDPNAGSLQATQEGKRIMDGIRLEIDTMTDKLQRDIKNNQAEVDRLNRLNLNSLVVVTCVALALFGSTFVFSLRVMRSQRAAVAEADRANAFLQDEIERGNETMQQLEANAVRLNEIIATQTLLAESQLDMENFLPVVVKSLLRLTPSQGAVIEMVDGDDMVYRIGSGTMESYTGFRLKRANSLSGLCIVEKKVLIANDTSTDLRVDRVACEKLDIGAMVVAPLFQAGQAVGVVKIVASAKHAFTNPDVQTAQLMAGLLGAALGHQLQFERNNLLLVERSHTLRALERELERRHEYEADLISSRQRTQAIIEVSHEAFICINSQSIITEWNAQAAATFGWTADEAIGQLIEELIIPEKFRRQHHEGMMHFMRTNEGPVLNRRIEMPAIRRNGEQIPVEMTISVLRYGVNGIEFPCFLRDISERKEKEQALMQQEQTLRSITDVIPALVAYFDSDQKCHYCNRQYINFFGIEAERVVGKTAQEFLGKLRYEQGKEDIDKALSGVLTEFDRPMMTPFGWRHVKGSYIPKFDQTNKVVGVYAIVWDVTAQKTHEKNLESRATIDDMTGLLNRAAFVESLNKTLSRQRKGGEGLAVMYLDVDHFKRINDTYGHATGDVVLRSFSDAIKAAVRESDVVGRMGGDEFCIVLDNLKTPGNAEAVAKKILANVSKPVITDNETLTISTSIGVAFMTRPGVNAERLIPLADAALYKAKQAGRNCYRLDVIVADLN